MWSCVFPILLRLKYYICSLEKYTSHTLFSKWLRKGWCWLCVRGELEMGIDCHILTPGSSDHTYFFLILLSCSTGVLRTQALYLELVLTASNSNCNCLKPSVAPDYIIVWHPPASCGRTHLHRIQPRPRVKVIFLCPRQDVPASNVPLLIYTGASLNWRLSRGSVCCNIIILSVSHRALT